MSSFEIVEIQCESNVNDDVSSALDDSNEKWQKLVLYYLARLKGLCDWRNNIKTTSKAKQNSKIRCTSQELETRIIDNITKKSNARLSRKQINSDENDIGYYIAAGYEEGKQQAVKIISRSLKYGVMTGILTKRGNCYRISPEYLYVCGPVPKSKPKQKQNKVKKNKIILRKCSVKSVKTNIRKRRKIETKTKKSNIALKNDGKKKINQKGNKRNYDDENEPPSKKNKRSSDTNVHLNESSNSNSTFQTLSRSLTPIDDRKNNRNVRAKRPRPKIQKPLNYIPPQKKPRTKSQSKSPSHHTDDDEVKDVHANSHMIINKFRMPRPRRYSNVMSSMSSSSLGSCKRCECDDHIDQRIKRTRRK